MTNSKMLPGFEEQDPMREPLYACQVEGRRELTLGTQHYRWPMERHCDPEMPVVSREAVAFLLERLGTAPDALAKGTVCCSICDAELPMDERELPGTGDEMSLTWPVALAHYVREHGLRIAPRLLRRRFGVEKP